MIDRYSEGRPEATDAVKRVLGFEAVEETLKTHQSSSVAGTVRRMTEPVDLHT